LKANEGLNVPFVGVIGVTVFDVSEIREHLTAVIDGCLLLFGDPSGFSAHFDVNRPAENGPVPVKLVTHEIQTPAPLAAFPVRVFEPEDLPVGL
jgi:hypothetical protein